MNFFFPGRWLVSLFPVKRAKSCDLGLKGLFVIKTGSLQVNSSHSRRGKYIYKKKGRGWEKREKEGVGKERRKMNSRE